MAEWVSEADGVFRGGGVKGLALAGALLGFAEHETKPVTKWVNVAGASAGAIIAAYLAIGKTADEMAALLKAVPYREFEDYPPGGKILGGGLNLLYGGNGLARGRKFRDWFSDVLEGRTFASVKDEEGSYRLRMIAVDVTRRDLLVLPEDLPKYRLPGASDPIDPDSFEIADAARMSMSLPYFFEPVKLIHAASGEKSLIIDGGTLSNFPVWLFDVDPRERGRPPRRPTFGFTLIGGKGFGGGFKRLLRFAPFPVRLGFDILSTAQEAWDERFAAYSTRVRTVELDAGDVATTEFDITPERQEWLISNGSLVADAFLDQFDLAEYRNGFSAAVEPA